MEDAINIQTEQSQPGTQKPDRTLRLDRIGRTIRRCILLARKLAEPLPMPRPTSARESTAHAAEDAAVNAESPGTEPGGTEPLETERPDRLDAPDRVDDLARRPIHEIVAEIARDLDIDPAETQSFKWNPGIPEHASAHEPASGGPPWRHPERPDHSEGAVATLLRTACPPKKPDPRPPKP